MREIWKTCLHGYYEVSNKGRVRRARPGQGTWIGRLLKLKENEDGYLQAGPSIKSRVTHHFVHKLVAEAFLGKRPDEMEINHKDLNKKNNCDWNLEYTTHRENTNHALKTLGNWQKRGERHPLSKMKVEDIVSIRKLYADGKYSHLKLAVKFNTSRSNIGFILSRATWKDVA